MIATPIVFFNNNFIQLIATVLSSSSEEPTLPAFLMKEMERDAILQTINISEINVTIDLGSAMSPTEFMIGEHNIPSGTTITLRANSSASWGFPPYSQAVTWHSKVIHKLISGQTYRYWNARFENHGIPLQLALPYLGTKEYPANNYRFGWQHIVEDLTNIDFSDGFKRYADLKSKRNKFRFSFKESEADKVKLENIFKTFGVGKSLFIALDYDANINTQTFFGAMESFMAENYPVNRFQIPDFLFTESL